MLIMKLKEKRQSLNLSQSQLADKSTINVRLIQDYEQGHKNINNAKAITVYRLANALDCTVEDLIETE